MQDRVIKYFKINTKWFALVTSSLVFITILFLQCWFLNSQKNEYNEVVNQFVENVMTGQAEKAMNLSTGIVRFNLNNAGQNNAGQGLTYKIKDIKTKTLVSKAGFAEVNAQIETENPSSMHWYKVSLIKKDDWKVFLLEETDPVLSKSGKISKDEVNKGVEVFTSYSQEVLRGNYSLASQFLIGQAKSNHDKLEQFFKDAIVMKDVNLNITDTEVIHSNQKELMLKIIYQLENQQVLILVSFFRLNDEWKIYSISEI